MYFDLRVRTEGFDLALQAEGASSAPIAIDELIAQAPLPETKGLITWTELGYFALLSIGAGVLFVALSLISAVVAFSVAGPGGPSGY
jgi:hypothetical protein